MALFLVEKLDSPPPQWSAIVRDYLDEHLSQRRTGHLPNGHSEVLTFCDFFLWRYEKKKVFAPPLPIVLSELKQRITTAIDGLDSDTLIRAWAEMNYRLDVGPYLSLRVHAHNICDCL
ncbi:DUF4817 domain-containing protein [Trichonephila clavipes]|nr:DUF4817 domain-containing protein [Trichonephila clavipes]